MSEIASEIIGVGSYLPETILSNEALAQLYQLDTTDEWIRERTGIHQRHIVREDETSATLALEASKRALDHASLTAQDLDMILCATTTPVYTFPSVAVMLQRDLGARPIPAFDIQAVCAGFTYALSVAHWAIQSGQAHTVLVVGTETMSRILNWQDRRTCVLFGDGAGAVILARSPTPGAQMGILGIDISADGSHVDKLYTTGGPSLSRTSGTVVMNGLEVFKQAIDSMIQSMSAVLEKLDLPVEAIDWFIPHQANQRILNAICKKMNICPSKMISTIAHHANTSAASIPLALDEAVRKGLIKKNQLVMLSAMGAGFTRASVLFRSVELKSSLK